MKCNREFRFIKIKIFILISQLLLLGNLYWLLNAHNHRNYPQKVDIRVNPSLFYTGLWPNLIRRRKSSNFYYTLMGDTMHSNLNSRKTTLNKYKRDKTKLVNYENVNARRPFKISKPKLPDIQETLNDTIVEEAVDPYLFSPRIPGVTVGDISVEFSAYTREHSPNDCGRSKYIESRIVNGRNAPLGSYPFVVSVLKYGDSWCGGSIINDYWVVSAAHCFSDKNTNVYSIRVGTVDRNNGRIYKITKIINHYRFNLDSMFNSDISLLKIEQPIRMGDYVAPICLPTRLYKEIESESLIVLGWGQLSFVDKTSPVLLQQVVLPVVRDEECAKKYASKGQTVYRSQLCTWFHGRDACQGDSGGPAIEYQNGRAYLAAIVSYGNTCADDFPGVYSQVSYFINWMINVMNQN